MIGGSGIDLMKLTLWGDHVRRAARPIIHSSPSIRSAEVPDVSLVAHIHGQTRAVRNSSPREATRARGRDRGLDRGLD